jgi:hypothetical protein
LLDAAAEVHMPRRLVSVSFAVALLGGCSADLAPAPGPVTSEPAIDAPGLGVGAVELASIDVDSARRVRLYEVRPGHVVIRETIDLDAIDASAEPEAALPPLARADLSGLLPSEVFAILAPSEAVPAALLAADGRVVAAAAAERSAAPAPPATAASGESRVDVARSADYYGDNYGAQWFLDNYCNIYNFRWCVTNWTGFYSGTINTSASEVCVMAADFDSAADFRGVQHSWAAPLLFSSGRWYEWELWNFKVWPRHIECMSGNQGVNGYYEAWATGLAPSPRVHTAVLHN